MGKKIEYDSMFEFFEQREDERKENGVGGKERQGEYAISLSNKKGLGTLICRIITDDYGWGIKTLYNVRELWLPIVNNEGVINMDKSRLVQFPDIKNWDNYSTLPQSSKKIYSEIMDYLYELNDSGYLKYGVPYRKEICYFYAKVSEFYKEGETSPDANLTGKVKIFRSHSGNFNNAFKKSILAKKMKTKDATFLDHYINRDAAPSTYLTTLTTSNSANGKGFDTAVTFDNDSPIAISLTQEDIAMCKDLSKIDTDLTQFDDAYWTGILNNLKLYFEALEEEIANEEDEVADSSVAATPKVEKNAANADLTIESDEESDDDHL